MKDNNQFYPTPWGIAERAAGLIKGPGGLLLEPSAGHGDLLKGMEYNRRGQKFTIKCVEIDPDNVAVLRAAGHDTIQADFLAMQLPRIYDAVLMNPPFNAGAKHILKAWSLLKQGGELVAIINRSALDNDFSADRQLLNTLIEKNGEIMDIGRAFNDDEAERKAAVDCAIIYMKRNEYEEDGINLTEDLKRGPEIRIEPDMQEFGLIKADFVSAAEEDYQRGIAEVFKGLESIEKGWKILNSRFGAASFHDIKSLDDVFAAAMQAIASKYGEGHKMETIKGDFVSSVRALAWLTVLDKTEVEKLLYSQDRAEFVNQILTDSRGVSFTKQNIVGFVHSIFTKRNDIFKGAVKKLFNELRRYHDGNHCHTEGWKTNKSWKVPEKIILPYGVTYDKYGYWNTSYHQDYLNDLDRIVRVLDCKPDDFGSTIKGALQDAIRAAAEHKRKYSDDIETPYFILKYFKKGTLHITFKKEHEEIRNRINAIGADGSLPDMNQ